MYNVRDKKQVEWVDYALDEKNPDGSVIFAGENLIKIKNTGEVWSYHAALERGIVFDPLNKSQEEEDWKEELIRRACAGDEEAISVLDQIQEM